MRLSSFLPLAAAAYAAGGGGAGERLFSRLPWLRELSAAAAGAVASPAAPRGAPSPGSADALYCPNSSFYEFLPVPVATLTAAAPSAQWPADGSCFASQSAVAALSASGVAVALSGASPSSPGCSEFYLVTTSFSSALVALSSSAPRGNASITFGADEAADVAVNGVGVYVLPCGLFGTVASALATVGLFDSDPAQMAATNMEFLLERGVWPQNPPVVFNKTVALDPSVIKSGDYLAIVRFDGLDPTIAWGTGGLTGHSALAVWRTEANGSRALFVTESTDANPLGPTYFPPPYGAGKTTPWADWVGFAQQAAFHVAVLPLSAANAAAFDEDAYWAWQATIQGMPYGYHSMLLSFLDTGGSTFANLPMPISAAEIGIALDVADALLGNSSEGVSMYSMLTEGFNQRTGSSCDTVRCSIAFCNANAAAGRKPASLTEAYALPELDSYTYGGNKSLVCSEFCAAGWKAGLTAAFPVWAGILAGEQTPKDNYQMQIYDATSARFTAATCPGGLVPSPQGNYCQIMGVYQMPLQGYNSVPLYAGMNNACPSQWRPPSAGPSYVRCPPGNLTCC